MEMNVLDRMSDLIMELGAMSIFTNLLVQNHADITREQEETMMYFISETLKKLYTNATMIGEGIDELLMITKKQ